MQSTDVQFKGGTALLRFDTCSRTSLTCRWRIDPAESYLKKRIFRPVVRPNAPYP